MRYHILPKAIQRVTYSGLKQEQTCTLAITLWHCTNWFCGETYEGLRSHTLLTVLSSTHTAVHTMGQHWKLNGNYAINNSWLTVILWLQPHMMICTCKQMYSSHQSNRVSILLLSSSWNTSTVRVCWQLWCPPFFSLIKADKHMQIICYISLVLDNTLKDSHKGLFPMSNPVLCTYIHAVHHGQFRICVWWKHNTMQRTSDIHIITTHVMSCNDSVCPNTHSTICTNSTDCHSHILWVADSRPEFAATHDAGTMALTFLTCRKSAPKVSHSSCTRSLCPWQDATRTAVQPSWGKGAIVDCDLAVLTYSILLEPRNIQLQPSTINFICVGVSFDVEKLIHYFSTPCGLLSFTHW